MGLPVPSGCLPLALCDFIIAQAARYVKSFFLVAPSFFKGAGSSLATTTPDYFAYRASLGFRGANPRRLYRRRSLGWERSHMPLRESFGRLLVYRGPWGWPLLLGHDGGWLFAHAVRFWGHGASPALTGGQASTGLGSLSLPFVIIYYHKPGDLSSLFFDFFYFF